MMLLVSPADEDKGSGDLLQIQTKIFSALGWQSKVAHYGLTVQLPRHSDHVFRLFFVIHRHPCEGM